MVNTVKFNVGGRYFEVSRDLIDQHSDTMLGKSVSDAWKQDPEETVFVDRNGDIFAYVLDYLRYGSIDLPVTSPKTMFDREIDFYGIESVEGAVNGVVEQIEVEQAGTPEVNGIYKRCQYHPVYSVSGFERTADETAPIYSKNGLWQGKAGKFLIYRGVKTELWRVAHFQTTPSKFATSAQFY